MQSADGVRWRHKFKGNEGGGAHIYTHPDAHEGRAIVMNHHGISFNGEQYASLDEAKIAALAQTEGGKSSDGGVESRHTRGRAPALQSPVAGVAPGPSEANAVPGQTKETK